MAEVVTLDPARLIFAAIVGLVILLVLIIKFKVHAMVSILIGAIAIGLIGGMPAAEIVSAVNDGIGNTLQGIALLIGLGSMFGAILEASGGAQTLAVTMVKKFGDEKAAWALGITGLIVAMPVFFDAGLIILIPLAFSLAKRTRRSTLFYAIPLLAGLAVGHAFIPPTPGPILVASMLGVDLGSAPLCHHRRHHPDPPALHRLRLGLRSGPAGRAPRLGGLQLLGRALCRHADRHHCGHAGAGPAPRLHHGTT